MLFLLTCLACDNSPEASSFPLCPECRESLKAAPPLCARCGSPICPSSRCLRPWITLVPLKSLSAAYLLIGPSYRVLRRWKISASPAFDRHVLRKARTQHDIDVIVPVPQSLRRSWALRHSPARKIAHWLSRDTGVP